ncbi:MAG: nucleotide exchange factor GrpE [Gemmatimonadaceae bacterium]
MMRDRFQDRADGTASGADSTSADSAYGGENADGSGVADVGGEITPAGDEPQTTSSTESPAQQLADQREKYLRVAAEYDNFRKRTAKERADAGARAQAQIVKEIVDALDDLGRFAHIDPASVDARTVVEGVELVERKLLKALTSAGLTVLNPVDQPFDPSQHEAVGTEPALTREDDHVVAQVYQQGYLFSGQLLRPARVVVKQWPG